MSWGCTDGCRWSRSWQRSAAGSASRRSPRPRWSPWTPCCRSTIRSWNGQAQGGGPRHRHLRHGGLCERSDHRPRRRPQPGRLHLAGVGHDQRQFGDARRGSVRPAAQLHIDRHRDRVARRQHDHRDLQGQPNAHGQRHTDPRERAAGRRRGLRQHNDVNDVSTTHRVEQQHDKHDEHDQHEQLHIERDDQHQHHDTVKARLGDPDLRLRGRLDDRYSSSASVADATGQGGTPTGTSRSPPRRVASPRSGGSCTLQKAANSVGISTCSVQYQGPDTASLMVNVAYSGMPRSSRARALPPSS